MKSSCCNAQIKKEKKSIYCSKCFKELNETEKIKWKHNRRKRRSVSRETQKKRSRRSYYRRIACKKGYLNIQQAAKMKFVRPSYVLRNLHKFHATMQHELKIRYDANFINWKPYARRLRK